jgi:Tfp pilus assembly protein FimV
MRREAIHYSCNIVWLWISFIALLFASNAIAIGTGGIQENVGEPLKVRIELILLASAGQTENSPRSDEVDPPDSVATPKPKGTRHKETRSARIQKPVVRSVKRKKHIPGSAPPSLPRAVSLADNKTAEDDGGKKKINPSSNLSLSLSMTLPIPANFSTQPRSPIKTTDAPLEPVAKEIMLSELYAQIAETEKRIRTQQSQLAILDGQSNSSPGVASSGVIAQIVAASNVPDIGKEKIKPHMVAPDVPLASKGEDSLIESLEDSWIQMATGLALAILTVLGFVWYRKGKAVHQAKSLKVKMVREVHEDIELVQPPVIAKSSEPVVKQAIKTPAHTEKKIQSILPPEYEMLEEADIYLRFGHDKLAEEALREAIRINPRNPQAYLTLSRIYFSREDSIAFLALAKQLKSLGDEDVWSKVTEMGRNLDPGNTLYS